MMNFIFRVILVLLGLVFAASLAVAALLLAAVWGLRYAWARLTGRPVAPWVMRFNPRSGFDRFRAAARPADPTAADVANARARGETASNRRVVRGEIGEVTDVRIKGSPSGN